jgi:Nucleotidyltransferase substrate binding protein like
MLRVCCGATGRFGGAFREMRARTSHTYDAKAALQVSSAIPGYLEEAEHFYAEPQRRLT